MVNLNPNRGRAPFTTPALLSNLSSAKVLPVVGLEVKSIASTGHFYTSESMGIFSKSSGVFAGDTIEFRKA